MLDRLQQDAQANELEPANTQPVVFLLLVLAQTLAVAVLCQYLPANYATVACFCIASHWLGFVFSVIIRCGAGRNRLCKQCRVHTYGARGYHGTKHGPCCATLAFCVLCTDAARLQEG